MCVCVYRHVGLYETEEDAAKAHDEADVRMVPLCTCDYVHMHTAKHTPAQTAHAARAHTDERT